MRRNPQLLRLMKRLDRRPKFIWRSRYELIPLACKVIRNAPAGSQHVEIDDPEAPSRKAMLFNPRTNELMTWDGDGNIAKPLQWPVFGGDTLVILPPEHEVEDPSLPLGCRHANAE